MGNSSLSEYFGRMLAAKPERIREVIEFRSLIEPGVAALAAVRRSEEDLARIRRMVSEQASAGPNPQADRDARFHMALARATKNGVIWEMAAVLHDLLSESRIDSLQSPSRAEVSLMGHQEILSALEAGDPERCREAMKTHLKQIGEQVGYTQDPEAP